MEIIRDIEMVRGRTKITFESGWKVYLKSIQSLPFKPEKGTVVSRDSMKNCICLQQYPEALEKAVTMLAFRACSRYEIEKKLLTCCYDSEVIELVLFKLEKESLLDDAEFADQWVRSRIRKYGVSRIARELQNKGIDRETIKNALDHCSDELQTEHAEVFARKKLDSIPKGTDPQKAFRQVTGMLLRRGYSWEISKKAFEKAAGDRFTDDF